MFGGDQSAFSRNNASTGGANIPTVIFIGTALSFSDQIIRIANVEFDGVAFERCDTPEDLRNSVEALDGVIAVVIDETQADHLPALLENCKAQDNACQIVLGYRDVALAASVFATLSDQGHQCAVSYLPMNQQFDIWLSIMRLLLCGGKYIPDELVQGISGANGEGLRTPPSDADLSDLTDREREVLALVSEGKPNKTIASELELSEHTIKLHIHHVITKLGVRNRTEAAILFLGGGAAGDGRVPC